MILPSYLEDKQTESEESFVVSAVLFTWRSSELQDI